MSNAIGRLNLSRGATVTLAAFGLMGVAMLASGRENYSDLHTLLDAGMFLLSGVLALLLSDMSRHLSQPFLRWLAISFAVTSLLEFIHALVGVEWAGPLASVTQAANVLRPVTWPPPAYLLPIGVGGSIWLLGRGGPRARAFALSLAIFGVGLLPVFYWLPRYSPPDWLGITRPTLILVPLLWVLIGWICWRWRARDRLLPILTIMAAVLVLAHLAMLYSRAPHDRQAMVAHLGKVGGYLVVLLSLMRMASLDMLERLRAERALTQLNEELDHRVRDRTAQLESANQSLEDEITVRRQAEQALRESQQLLQAIVDNSMAVIYVKDLAGRYLLANHRFEEIFHLAPGAILGKTDYDFFSKAAADAFRAMDERVAAADHTLTEEESAPQDDGLHTYVSIKSPLRDNAGKTYAIFGISTDITGRKQAEQRLQVQLSRLDLLSRTTRAIGERQDLQSIFQVVIRTLEDQLPIDFGCICLYDPASEVLTVTRVGIKSQALALELALPERAQIPVDQNGLSRCVQGQLVYEPDIKKVEFPFPQRLTRGGLRSLVIAPLLVESQVFGVLVAARRQPHSFSSPDCEFLRQLSEHVALAAHQAQLYNALQQAYDDLRQTQQAIMQQERLRALGQMASGIAHDINNAISPVALYTESLLANEPNLSVRARDYLETMQHAIEDVAATVARMREFYRQREPQLLLAPVHLNRLVQQVVELTRARWSDMPLQRGIVIKAVTELSAELPPIMGVEGEIREALTNLVFNAVDALPEGGTITLRTSVAESAPGLNEIPARRHVQVEITDSGIGMSEETRRRCVEPFFTTKGERGTGLGLAMVYGMIQRHSAEIEIDSTVGKGTTVRLSFPIPVAVIAGPEPSELALASPSRVVS